MVVKWITLKQTKILSAQVFLELSDMNKKVIEVEKSNFFKTDKNIDEKLKPVLEKELNKLRNSVKQKSE